MRLFDITQIAAARVVDMRNVLPLLQFAHLTRAHLLQDICMQVPALLCMLGRARSPHPVHPVGNRTVHLQTNGKPAAPASMLYVLASA